MTWLGLGGVLALMFAGWLKHTVTVERRFLEMEKAILKLRQDHQRETVEVVHATLAQLVRVVRVMPDTEDDEGDDECKNPN